MPTIGHTPEQQIERESPALKVGGENAKNYTCASLLSTTLSCVVKHTLKK